jgi:hypothetical protein
MSEETGDEVKLDHGKTRWSLIPRDFLRALADLYTKGAVKYGPHAWRVGADWSRFMDARDRHLDAWDQGEDYCPKDGQHHLVAAAWNCIALWWFQYHGRGRDDRADTPIGALAEGEPVKIAPEIGKVENIRFINTNPVCACGVCEVCLR